MHIGIITPAKARALCGNRTTATRWARFLRDLGHRVSIGIAYDDREYDLLIALHAWRSADAIQRFRELHPDRPLVVAMTGTDLYRFIHSHPEPTLRSVELADRLIVLHDLAYKVLPESAWDKISVIYQSARPITRRQPPARRSFDFCVVGHLRDEKDPLRPAYAARNLPATSKIRILQYGKAHNKQWAKKAAKEMQTNTRYHWLGERPNWEIRKAYSRCRALILPSLMEGGANVVSEASVAGLPVIASDIAGSIGLLGEDYKGFYPVEDTDALRALLMRTEAKPGFLAQLQKQIVAGANRFTPERERDSLREMLERLA